MWSTLGLRAALSVLLLSALLGAVELSPSREAERTSHAARVVVHVRDTNGRPLVARVRAVPLELKRRLLLGEHAASQVAIGGEATLELAPGRYRVLVTRGPTYAVGALELSLTADSHSEHTLRLAREARLEGVLCADLHVHTAHSEDAKSHGGVSGLALLAEGLEGTVATDHNHVGALDGELPSLPGAEITTWAPEVGHFSAFPLRALPRWRKTTPSALLRELSVQPDVFVQINHPRLEDHIAYFALGGFDGSRFHREEFEPTQAHGLEVWNGYDLPREGRLNAVLSDWRRLNERGLVLTATGGSDSHGRPGHLAGYPRTCAEARTMEDLPRALREGRAFVTSGPLLSLRVEGKRPGEQVPLAADGKVEVEVGLRAGTHAHVEELQVWAGERLVARRRLPADQGKPQALRRKLRVDPQGARTLHVLVRGSGQLGVFLGRDDVPALAFTNVVHLARKSEPRRQKRPASAKNAP